MVFLSENPEKLFDKDDIPHNPTSATKLSEVSEKKIVIFQKLHIINHLLFGLFPILKYMERGSKHGVDVRAGAL